MASRMKFWLRAVAAQQNDAAAACLQRFLRVPMRTSFATDQRKKTMRAILRPYADVEAFAELYPELGR